MTHLLLSVNEKINSKKIKDCAVYDKSSPLKNKNKKMYIIAANLGLYNRC